MLKYNVCSYKDEIETHCNASLQKKMVKKKKLRIAFCTAVIILSPWFWKIISANVALGLLLAMTSILLATISDHRRYKLWPLIFLFLLICFWQGKTTKKQNFSLGLREGSRRVVNNFVEAIDPNLYFFANHPRERVGIPEFEKFFFFFLPFFVLGFFNLVRKWPLSLWLLALAAPLFLTSLTGHQNFFGPFSIFPFITAAVTAGFFR